MNIQKEFEGFHKAIKVDTSDLRDSRDVLFDKVKASLKKAGHPVPEILNQGSYIYGVGIWPPKDVEYDIDVGLDFDILADEYSAEDIRNWVYSAVEEHTNKVKKRGPCIRVHYEAGYHVDLVVYARHKDKKDVDNYQLGTKDGWKPSDPKKLKQHILDSRKPFESTKGTSGADQLQRVTRYLKRWNDLDIPEDSDDKPFGLATLLLVIKYLTLPVTDTQGASDDLSALINICTNVSYATLLGGRISINKPTPEYEDVFKKISDTAMTKLVSRFKSLKDDLTTVKSSTDVVLINKLMKKHFGDDFPDVEDPENKNKGFTPPKGPAVVSGGGRFA